jgi:hypothetical protein
MASARVSQQYVEIVSTGNADEARLSQQYVELLDSGTTDAARLSQQYVEVLAGPYRHSYATLY